MKQCPQCSTPNRDDARFCAICGAELAVNQCPKCHAVVSTSTKFCPSCGYNLGVSPANSGPLNIEDILEERYKIEQVIGQGGFSVVYRAIDTWSVGQQKWCAIKELSDKALNETDRDEAVKYFKREVGMLTHLTHPNIPKVSDYFTHGHRHYLVMDYIEGQNLQSIIDSRQIPFTEKQVVEWGVQLCDTLHYLHTQNPAIIFRDVKPLNIMIDRNEQVKLIDFGIARLFSSAQRKDTQKLGSPGYAPPEQYNNHTGHTDARSDIYALGVTLHQLLTLHDPSDDVPMVDKIPARKLNPNVSTAMERIITTAVQQDPQKRHQTAGEMRQSLQGLLTDTTAQPANNDPLANLYQQGETAFQQRDYAAAIRLWGQIWSQNPNYRDVTQRITLARQAAAPKPQPAIPSWPVKPTAQKWQDKDWFQPVVIGVGIMMVLGFILWTPGIQPRSATPTKQTIPVASTTADAVAKRSSTLYQDPGTYSERLMTVNSGTELTVVDKQEGNNPQWVRVEVPTETGKQLGWISLGQITLNIPLENIPTRIPTHTPTHTPTLIATPKWDAEVRLKSNLLAGPGYNYDTIGQTSIGDHLIILAVSGGKEWFKVRVNNNSEGWVSRDSLIVHVPLGNIPVAKLPTKTPTPARTPTANRKPAPTRTPTRRPTATPKADAIITVDSGNLRSGPGTNYDVVGQVSKNQKIIITGKNEGGDWVSVKVGTQQGWLSTSLLELNIALSGIKVASIPPTPTPGTPTATPTPKVCPADPALVMVRNQIEVAITLKLSGPDTFSLTVPSGDSRNICIPPGTYKTTSSASGYYTETDTDTFKSGACKCWEFYQLLNNHPICDCPNNVTRYFRP